MTSLRSSGTSTYATWLGFFIKGEGSWSRFVVKAFLDWLFRFVLPRDPEDELNLYVLSFAVLLAKGELALAFYI